MARGVFEASAHVELKSRTRIWQDAKSSNIFSIKVELTLDENININRRIWNFILINVKNLKLKILN